MIYVDIGVRCKCAILNQFILRDLFKMIIIGPESVTSAPQSALTAAIGGFPLFFCATV